MYKRICITCKYLWFVWQRSIVAQSLKSLWGQCEGALEEGTCASGDSARAPFEEGTCAFLLPRWGSALRTLSVGKEKFEVLLEVHQAIEDAPNTVKPGRRSVPLSTAVWCTVRRKPYNSTSGKVPNESSKQRSRVSM